MFVVSTLPRQSGPGGDAGSDGFGSHRPGQMFDAYSLQESSWQSVRDPWLAATVSLDMAGRLRIRLDDAATAAISHRHFDGDTIKAQSIIDLRLTHTEILKPSPGHGHA